MSMIFEMKNRFFGLFALSIAGSVAADAQTAFPNELPNLRGFGRVEVTKETIAQSSPSGDESPRTPRTPREEETPRTPREEETPRTPREEEPPRTPREEEPPQTPREEVAVLRFACETAENAETVAGKFLMDLSAQDGVSFRDGIHETPGGAAFAVERDGNLTAIYASGSREALEECLAHSSPSSPRGETLRTLRTSREEENPQTSRGGGLVSTAAVPEYMKAFRWGVYGIGGPENYHSWMDRAKQNAGIDPKADKAPLDPREDFDFLHEMGNLHFDNWLQMEAFDNSDGIISPLVHSRKKLAEDFGIPFGYRVYMPAGTTGSYNWYTRRFAGRADQPPKWLQNGWLRYYAHASHQSWFDADAWGYNAARTMDAMRRVRTGAERSWMHPAGELVHRPWYDWHADCSQTAATSWRRYLARRGVSLADAAAMYNRPDRPFASWREVPVPEFATFAGLSGLALDLWGDWETSDVLPGAASAAPPGAAEWQPLPRFPGNWDFLGLYAKNGRKAGTELGDGRRPEQKALKRRFRRKFEWRSAAAAPSAATSGETGRTWLYFFPMSGETLRHEVSLNGGAPHVVGNWCALDVTDELRDGGNTLDILLQGSIWNGRVFLSTEKPRMYPNMAEARCRLWTLWHDWRRDEKAERAEAVFDAMRQADPDAPIEFMAPMHFGQRIANRLLHDWGGFAHFTGEGSWFFPWYKRYAKLYGYQGTSELAGPSKDVAGAKRSALRVFLAGLDMHKPVFLAQTYSRNPPLRDWWLSHKDLFARMGRYDIDLKQPQVLIYRRTELTGDAYPAPFPAIDETAEAPRSPWNYDIGRGELQSIGQSFLYIDDDGLEDGKMDGFRVMFDCGNEIIPEDEVARIAAWVERGGVFVAYPFTGRSTPLHAGAWPMAALTGSKIKADEKIVTPGNVPKVHFPEGSRFFPSFAGQTIHGAKRRLHQLDWALETVADDTEPILFWEDGRIAATARRIGEGLVVHLGSMFWRGSEDVKGMWNPQDEVERAFLRDLLAAVGHPPALVETDDRLVLAQPYRSHDGLDLVAVLCNFNEEPDGDNPHAETQSRRETVVKLRCGRKPRRIVGYAGMGIINHGIHGTNGNSVNPVNLVKKRLCDSASLREIPFDWDEAEGVATVRVALPPQEVAILNAECYSPADALDYWWRNSAEQWHEIKKPVRDFSKYFEGEWKDPTQDLKTGWEVCSVANVEMLPVPIANTNSRDSASLREIPLDCLQFWGWPEGKGAVCRKVFDLDEPAWAERALQGAVPSAPVPAQTRLVVGAWVGPNFLSPATIRLNGETLAADAKATYLDFDVSARLKARGNVLEVEFADAADGGKFTGMNGSVYLYHRAKPAKSLWAKGDGGQSPQLRIVDNPAGSGDSILLFVPSEWRGRYRVRLYMEGVKDVPKGVRVGDRFMRRHHHDFGNITDIDITDLLVFGAENRIDIGANSPAEMPDKRSAKPLSVLRLDLYPAGR